MVSLQLLALRKESFQFHSKQNTISSRKESLSVSNHDRIVAAIFRAVDELNKQLPKGVHVERSLDSPLYGKSGRLESIDVVTLIMEVEDQISKEFGTSITIADDRAMSQQNSPFLTIGTLTDYVAELLNENGAAGS